MAITNIEIKVKGYLRTALSAEASTTTIDVDFVNEDDTSTAITLQSDTLMFEIDPLNKTGKGSEICLAASNAADTPVSDRTRFSTVVRGLSKEGHEQTGSATRARSWDEGTEVAIATGTMAKMVNLLLQYQTTDPLGTLYTGDNTFSGANSFTKSLLVPVYATTTTRDAAITSPSNGMICYVTADGVLYQYIGGAWATFATGTVANASSTVAGKVEMATTAELLAGSDTGGTGAQAVAGAPELADALQLGTITYAADAEASDTYVVTMVPAITAYATGQVLTVKFNTVNTGACTINVNAKGAKSIKRKDGQDPLDGDIAAGDIRQIIYDGTNFVLQDRHVDVQTFTSSGTWTKRAHVKVVKVVAFGGGGGGGGGEGNANGVAKAGGTGGGGGGRAEKLFKASDLGATETVTIGAAGTSGAGGSTAVGSDGGAGGNTTFGAHLKAWGGGAGAGGTIATSASGGGGGGTASAGQAGQQNGNSTGGTPGAGTSITAQGSAGAAGQNGAVGGAAERGGGAGGGKAAGNGAGQAGGDSLYGAGGGGGAGGVSAADGALDSAAGGGVQSYSTGGGGAAGTKSSGGAGTAGTAGDSTKGGTGGGGGGCNISGTGGAGGAGAQPGGGGGAGGAGEAIGGAGGIGGAGQVWVYSW